MDVLQSALDLILHFDVHLDAMILEYGLLTYVILFLIIFCETGLVIMPFLPGDSLLFAAGALAARGTLNPWILFILLTVAAILGDGVNYAIGHYFGPKVFRRQYRFLNHEHLMETQKFYEVHGGKTIVMARFLPIIRTLAPFVAGVGTMKYSRFASYNIAGGVLWVGLFVFGGYVFGTLPFVAENFEHVILSIIVISVLPLLITHVRRRFSRRKQG